MCVFSKLNLLSWSWIYSSASTEYLYTQTAIKDSEGEKGGGGVPWSNRPTGKKAAAFVHLGILKSTYR